MSYVKSDKITNLVQIDTNVGSMIVKLDPDNAPKTVKNFQDLVSQGFYNGLIFHRVIADFMIQGGDPLGTGFGGSEKRVVGEFKANGVNNTISHKRGVISMARSQFFNSASSQFFICHKDATFLDGQYAAFGEVVEGIETVDSIAGVPTDRSDKPIKDQVMKNVYFVEEE